MSKKKVLNKSQIRNISIILITIVACAIIGFIYEEIFYRFEYSKWVKRGTSFGPWIPIYGLGSFFIITASDNMKNKTPLRVFFLGVALTTATELICGMMLDKIWGLRLWNYNTEMLNWGNIGGYICFRSIAFFSISSLFIVYYIKPFFENISKKYNTKKFDIYCICLGLTFILDTILSFFIKIF